MLILCIICSDLFTQVENIYVTKCGHMFHLHCLSQWIERSKTCPHCRCKVTEECMFRIFPMISNENETEDAAIFKSRLDDALLQLRQEVAANKQKDEKLALAIANSTNKNLLIKACTKKLITKQCTVAALRERLNYIRVECEELQKTKEENLILKQNIHSLTSLQNILSSTSVEVEQILETYSDVRIVATFAAVLRRALYDLETKRKKEHDRLEAAAHQLAAEKVVSANLRASLLQLQDKLAATERKYENLRGKQKRPSNFPLAESGEHYGKKIRGSSGRGVSNGAVMSTRDNDFSITSMVSKIVSPSPYLRAVSPILPVTRTLLVPTTRTTPQFTFLDCRPDLTLRSQEWRAYIPKKY